MDWSNVDNLWIIVMLLSAVWTLVLTAPIHCRASIGERKWKLHFSKSDEETNSSTSWMVWGSITWICNWVFTQSVPPELISTALTENKPWPPCTRWPSSRNACWAEERRASPTGRWGWAAPASPWKPRSCGWGWWPGNRPSQSAPPAGYRERNTAGARAAATYRNRSEFSSSSS